MKQKRFNFYFFALAALGEGLSGGDRIFIELARRWAKWGHEINIYLWQEGYGITQAQRLKHKNINFHIVNMGFWPKLGFVVNYFARIVVGVYLGLTLKLEVKERPVYLYSCSDFWMDCLPAFLLKLRFPKAVWFAAWYQTAPNPLKGFAEGARGKTYRMTAFLYWLSQLPIKPLITTFADFVLVNNEDEKREFPVHTRKGRTVVVLGAVPLEDIKRWIAPIRNLPKIYDAVFQGRFHPQKGVVELIDIWKKVVEKKPDAVLGMIGDGELMENVKSQISNYKLEKNVKLFGYVFDGPRKYRIFSQGKVVVHPAFYDSGGMAAAEAMACGLPCVGFSLKSYESYYPKGMVKVKTGDLTAFANMVLKLINDEKYRKRVTNEALEMIESYWSWEKRAKDVLLSISTHK